ncbi:MAG: FAD-dependent oxidoreductase [Desulfobacterales bacterium]
MAEKFDCVIIGAGPAGLTAALILARSGMSVVVVERGQYPGSKNMFGGVLYCRELNEIIPEFWEKAPVERPVMHWNASFLRGGSKISLNYENLQYNMPPYNAFTVLRARFDQWYADVVQEAGAVLVTETLVEDLLYENNKIVGVRTGRDNGEIIADVVVAADGVNTIVRRKAELLGELCEDETYLGVKEILSISEKALKKNFNLSDNEGAAHLYIGDVTDNVPGGAFIYTNKDSISVGIVVNLAYLVRSRLNTPDLLEKFKRHPLVQPYVKDSEPSEYLAHLIPEPKFCSKNNFYADGLLITGDAAGFTLNTGLRLEGANPAITSGRAAAEAIIKAAGQGGYTAKNLHLYHEYLEKYGLLEDLKKFRHAPDFFKNRRLYKEYPELTNGLAEGLFSVEPGSRKGIGTVFRERINGRLSRTRILKDVYSAWRALG